MKNTKELTCISCPMGCLLEVEYDETGVTKVSNQGCKRGEIYAIKEITDPRRIVTSIIPVRDGVEEMVSVKTATDIPKSKVQDCILALKGLKVSAPIEMGQVILDNIANTGVSIIATKRVAKKTMDYYVIQTPIVPIGFGIEEGFVVRIDFRPTLPPNGIETTLSKDVSKQLIDYMLGSRKQLNIPYLLKGTPFQMKVFKAMKDIPLGQTRSYQDLAQIVGIPKGSRAIGNACGSNPLPLIIPCHRVIRTDGKLGGFSGGLDVKIALLKQENILF